jgi:hypothetical protein
MRLIIPLVAFLILMPLSSRAEHPDECLSKTGEESCVNQEIQRLAEKVNGTMYEVGRAQPQKVEACDNSTLNQTPADAIEALAECKITMMQQAARGD